MLPQVVRSSRHAVAQLSKSRSFPVHLRSPGLGKQRLAICRHDSFGSRAFGTTSTLSRRYLISEGRITADRNEKKDADAPSSPSTPNPSSPFYLETGYSIFAKRPSRPFPPPFVSLPSGSFSDPLTTHNPSSVPRNARRPMVNGQSVRGITNGDDAIIIGAGQRFIAVNDGVGAWAQKERGHAALWSRLIAHFWDLEVEKSLADGKERQEVDLKELDPVGNLQVAYEATKNATKGTLKRDREDEVYSEAEEGDSDDSDSPSGSPSSSKPSDDSSDGKESSKNDILGTTTASSALLYHTGDSKQNPVILATTLGDCKVLIVRPDPPPDNENERSHTSSPSESESESESTGGTILYHSKEQWHWFDCPRQLGTNSPDTPTVNAVCDTIEDIRVGDVVAVLSDGVTDNLWEHEICQHICESILLWKGIDNGEISQQDKSEAQKNGIVYVARRLMTAAREIAMDPNAESPYMERAFDEGIAAEGGKLDDISVVLGIVRKREE